MKVIVYTCNICFVFQWNSTMISTISNDVINVKPYWGCCFWILVIYLLVRKIDTWTLSTESQCTFPVWKCMIRLRICAYFSLFHIISFGINMTPMWHHCIFICFIFVVFLFIRPFVQNWMVRNEYVLLLSQNGRNEILKGANTCTYRF